MGYDIGLVDRAEALATSKVTWVACFQNRKLSEEMARRQLL